MKLNYQSDGNKSERGLRPQEEYTTVENALKNLSPDSEYLIEETQVTKKFTSLFTSLKIYEVQNGKIKALGGTSKDKLEQGRALRGFIEEFLEPTHLNRRGYKNENRIWRATGKKAEALRKLFTTGLKHLVVTHGWKGLKKMIHRLKTLSENPLKFDKSSPLSPLKNLKWPPELGRELIELKEIVTEQADERDSRPIDEITVAMTLKSEDFAERYRKVKSKISEKAEELESTFSFLLSKKSGENDHEEF